MNISFNGTLFQATDRVISPANRAFRYGDGIFETIRVWNGRVLWAPFHYDRLCKGCRMLQIRFPGSLNKESFVQMIVDLYNRNHPDGCDARIRFSLFRADGGFYTPQSNEAMWIIESQRLSGELYTLNDKGLQLGIYPLQRKPVDQLSQIKSSSALLFVMASLYKTSQGLDDCLVLNAKGNIAEATGSNLFIVRDGVLKTPGLDEGCVGGVMRTVIMQLSEKQDIALTEGAVSEKDLLESDEVFLTNTISGIQWVGSFDRKQYGHKWISMLMTAINEAAKNGLSMM
jgi:branched-subunit amino acid aminotransferase/4-amino-4-deoxychorismate lyase